MALHDLFTHRSSPLIDVAPNARGEFVQVWDGPLRAERRRLLLTYLRTPSGPVDVCHRIELPDSRFSIVETCGTQRIFYYREDPTPPRVETILPSARILVSDPRVGEVVEAVFSAEFDWTANKPKGKPLGDKAVMKLQSAGGTWFRATYQRRGDNTTLAVVEEYKGHDRKSLVEFEHEV
jgi:hypothetical protein